MYAKAHNTSPSIHKATLLYTGPTDCWLCYCHSCNCWWLILTPNASNNATVDKHGTFSKGALFVFRWKVVTKPSVPSQSGSRQPQSFCKPNREYLFFCRNFLQFILKPLTPKLMLDGLGRASWFENWVHLKKPAYLINWLENALHGDVVVTSCSPLGFSVIQKQRNHLSELQGSPSDGNTSPFPPPPLPASLPPSHSLGSIARFPL